ncbi:MAG TPA: hypothetical protein VH950_14920 [Gaiellaceae bacterium]
MTSAVTGPVQADAAARTLGTPATATATCPPGTVLLGGGASATTSLGTQLDRVALAESAPVAPNLWRATAMTLHQLSAANRARILVWVVCTV